MRRQTTSPLVAVAVFAVFGLFGLLVLFGAGALRAAEEKARLARRDGFVVLTELPPILEEDEVAKQLGSGLTTTFVFRIDSQGGSREAVGGARAEIRYELWDEVFHVVAAGVDGRVDRRAIATREKLAEWWRELTLTVVDGRSGLTAGMRQVRVSLEVVPFSRAEQDDTQRWFAEGLGRTTTGGESAADSPDDREGSLEQVFSVLIATSIQRRSLISYRWTLDLPEPAE